MWSGDEQSRTAVQNNIKITNYTSLMYSFTSLLRRGLTVELTYHQSFFSLYSTRKNDKHLE